MDAGQVVLVMVGVAAVIAIGWAIWQLLRSGRW